jgi:hypothetical protein
MDQFALLLRAAGDGDLVSVTELVAQPNININEVRCVCVCVCVCRLFGGVSVWVVCLLVCEFVFMK